MDFLVLSTPVFFEPGFLIAPLVYSCFAGLLLAMFYKKEVSLKQAILIAMAVGTLMAIRLMGHEFSHLSTASLFDIECLYVRFDWQGGAVAPKNFDTVPVFANMIISAAGSVFDMVLGILFLSIVQRTRPGNIAKILAIFGGMSFYNGFLNMVSSTADSKHFTESLTTVVFGDSTYVIAVSIVWGFLLVMFTFRVIVWYNRGKKYP
jgi:hypothetical protein